MSTLCPIFFKYLIYSTRHVHVVSYPYLCSCRYSAQNEVPMLPSWLDAELNLGMQVLESESTNVKALYRRAQAYINLADLDLAEIDIKKALEIDPNNRYVPFKLVAPMMKYVSFVIV